MNQISFTRRRRIDGLRGFLAVYVLFFHCVNFRFDGSRFETAVLAFLNCIVPTFFVISGFLVQASFAKNYSSLKFPKLSFFINRFFRIWPLWILLLVYYALKRGMKLDAFLLNASFLFGFFPMVDRYLIVVPSWSLFIEEVFYLAFPWIQKINRGWRVLVSVGLFYGLARWTAATWLPMGWPAFKGSLSFVPTYNFHYFFIGIALYRLSESPSEWKQTFQRWLDAEIMGRITLFDFTLFAATLGFTFTNVLSIEFMAIGFALTAVATRGTVVALFESRVLVWLGIRCYAFYILQELAIELFEHPYGLLHTNQSLHEMQVFASAFGVLVVLSAISFEVIEKPAVRFGKRLVESLNRAPEPTFTSRPV